MPTYQYACTECGHAFEQVQSFSDDALTTCPECTGRLRKVFNAVGVVFKGSGFYRTDSRSNGSSSGSGSSNGSGVSETKNGSKTETASETKSDAKSGDSSAKAAPASSTTSASSSSS